MVWYYTRPVLFTLCLANEATFVMWYMRHFAQTPEFNINVDYPFLWYLLNGLLILSTPLCIVKNFINLVQWYEAAKDMVEYETEQKNKETCEAKESEKKE